MPGVAAGSAAAASGGFVATAAHRFRDELGDVQAGFSYIGHSSNRCALLQRLTIVQTDDRGVPARPQMHLLAHPANCQ